MLIGSHPDWSNSLPVEGLLNDSLLAIAVAHHDPRAVFRHLPQVTSHTAQVSRDLGSLSNKVAHQDLRLHGSDWKPLAKDGDANAPPLWQQHGLCLPTANRQLQKRCHWPSPFITQIP